MWSLEHGAGYPPLGAARSQNSKLQYHLSHGKKESFQIESGFLSGSSGK